MGNEVGDFRLKIGQEHVGFGHFEISPTVLNSGGFEIRNGKKGRAMGGNQPAADPPVEVVFSSRVCTGVATFRRKIFDVNRLPLFSRAKA